MFAQARQRYQVQIVTPAYEVVGQLETIGSTLDYLNNRETEFITIHDARVSALTQGAPAVPDQAQIHLNRSQICFVILLDQAARAGVNLLKQTQVAISQVSSIVCRGEYHMGSEWHLATYFEDQHSQFFPITNVELYSPVSMPVALPRKAEMILANRAFVQLYYPG